MTKSFKGLGVGIGIVGTIAAVVVMFAYAVSDDIYPNNLRDVPAQSSAQFSSTVSGQDNFEATDDALPLEASFEADAGLTSVDQPAPPLPTVPVKEPPAAANDDNQIIEETQTQSAPLSVPAMANSNAESHVVDEDPQLESNQTTDRPERTAPKIESIALTQLSADRHDDKGAFTDESEGLKEKKDKDHDRKSGKGDGHKHDKDHKGKGKGHHKD